MNKPRLESVYFGTREYHWLAGVLEKSARFHLKDRWEINVRKIEGHNLKAALSSKYVRKELFPNNAHKALAWCEIIKEAPIGDRILLIDCDTFIRAPLDEIWELDFDYARTTRDYKWPWNSGVMFVRVNEKTKKFFELITEETFKMLGDARYHEIYEKKFGGIHQASIAATIERNLIPGFKVLDIPCLIWNSEHTHRGYEDFIQSKIVHLLPSGRKKILKGDSWANDKNWRHIGKEWHSWAGKIVYNYRWDEVVSKLDELGNGLIIAEIGVWDGLMTDKVLKSDKISMYHLVDPWKACTPNSSWCISGSKLATYNQVKFDKALKTTRLRIKRDRRAKIHQMESLEAVKLFPDNYFDLVFIDADHSYEGCNEDIRAWLPKVKVGGYLCGHDFDEPRFLGIREAVEGNFGDNYTTGEDYTWFHKVGGNNGGKEEVEEEGVEVGEIGEGSLSRSGEQSTINA